MEEIFLRFLEEMFAVSGVKLFLLLCHTDDDTLIGFDFFVVTKNCGESKRVRFINLLNFTLFCY